jgi:hypothetical protein
VPARVCRQEESSLPSKPKQKAAPKKDKKPVEKPAGPGALAAGGGLGSIPLHQSVEVNSEDPVEVRHHHLHATVLRTAEHQSSRLPACPSSYRPFAGALRYRYRQHVRTSLPLFALLRALADSLFPSCLIQAGGARDCEPKVSVQLSC